MILSNDTLSMQIFANVAEHYCYQYFILYGRLIQDGKILVVMDVAHFSMYVQISSPNCQGYVASVT